MIHTRRFATVPARAALGAAATILLLASCVTQARHKEATDQVQYYQRLYQDLEAFQGQLEAENARLEGELQLYRTAGPIEAGMTEEIDERMRELERMAGSLGGKPGEVTVLAVQGGYGLRLADSILFESGSAEIREGGGDVLARMAREIQSRPFERVWVRGHTDSDPVKKPETKRRFPHGNLELSSARAISVAVALAENGIDSKLLVVAGFGPNEPVVPNDSALGKQKNRRVEIFVIEDEEAASATASH